MNVGGKWEGKLIDATGATAVIELNLADRKGNLTGDFSIYFLSEAVGCCGGERRLAQSGPVSGSVSPKTGSVRLDYKVTIGGKPTAVRYGGKITSETNGHARAAIVGCFSASDKSAAALTLAGGGAVLWRYAA